LESPENHISRFSYDFYNIHRAQEEMDLSL
jgi:hypothetical protein